VLENEKLREQLQSFLTQYEVRDKHFEQQIQAKEAEKLVAEEKQAKVPKKNIVNDEAIL
jgi:hypothetical protein